MRSTYQAKNGIVALLIAAQGASPPAIVMPEVDIFNFNPGDFRFDNYIKDDGIYIYFDKSNFPDNDDDPGSQGHTPSIHIDFYVASSATKSTSTGAVVTSPQIANDALEVLVKAVWDAVMDSRFTRLLHENIVATAGADYWEPADCKITESEFMGTMNLKDSAKTQMCHRYVVGVKVEEISNTDDGRALDGRDTHIAPQRTPTDDGSPP